MLERINLRALDSLLLKRGWTRHDLERLLGYRIGSSMDTKTKRAIWLILKDQKAADKVAEIKAAFPGATIAP